jgi:drug/metabolite transporter (DMT)-like permease
MNLRANIAHIVSTAQKPATASEHAGLWLAALAVLCFSTAPVMLIWADPLSPFEKSAWRLAVAALSTWFLARAQRQPLIYDRRGLGRFLFFGLIMGLHILVFVAAFNFTSIAHVMTITHTAPIFATIFSVLLLKEHIARRKYLGIAIVVAGIAVLTGFEPAITPEMILGDGLALIAAVTFGLYSVLGRSQRNSYPLLTYTTAVYGFAALWLLPAAVLNFTPGAYGWQQILAVIGTSVIPIGLGHTLFNAAVRRTHATYVSLVATQAVTGSVLLGAIFLSQMPSTSTVVGALITLIGVALVLI